MKHYPHPSSPTPFSYTFPTILCHHTWTLTIPWSDPVTTHESLQSLDLTLPPHSTAAFHTPQQSHNTHWTNNPWILTSLRSANTHISPQPQASNLNLSLLTSGKLYCLQFGHSSHSDCFKDNSLNNCLCWQCRKEKITTEWHMVTPSHNAMRKYVLDKSAKLPPTSSTLTFDLYLSSQFYIASTTTRCTNLYCSYFVQKKKASTKYLCFIANAGRQTPWWL